MISLTPLINTLAQKPAAFNGQWFRQVAGAAEYAQIRPEALPLPACWIVRGAENVSHAGERAEDTEFIFDVVIAIENVRRHQPGDIDDLLLAYRRAVKDKLLGLEFDPASEVNPIKFKGGRVLQYTDGDFYWADRYSFNALITNYLNDPAPYLELKFTGETL